jgi:AIG2-like family
LPLLDLTYSALANERAIENRRPGEGGMKFLYYAYGSNMLPARLTARCPSAVVVGTANAPNHRLEFTKRGLNDGSGKATLVRAGERGVHIPGVLFEIARADLSKLDAAEGAGKGYDRHDQFEVLIAATGERVSAKTYLATKTEAHLKPYDWYLALVLAGAHHHELDAAHARRLREVEYVVDDDLNRKGRSDALAALAAHRYDHRILLKT